MEADADAQLKQTEMERRDAGADRYGDYFSEFANTTESRAILDALQPQADDVVIELGVGTGRIAVTYGSMVHGVLGVDLSFKSLEIARDILETLGINCCLIQADICRLPIKTASFAKAVSPEVFEHLPSVEARDRGLAEAARILKPDGTFIITVYHHSWLRRLRGIFQPSRCPKEDFGPDYSFSFYRSEFNDWLASHFEVESIRGLRSTALERLPILGRVGLFGERAIQRTPLSFLAAHLLQGVARKRPHGDWQGDSVESQMAATC
jgi:ubiquinone/menaquinone biosynthesis C-methylase UbiE